MAKTASPDLNWDLRVDAAAGELRRCGAFEFRSPWGLAFLVLRDDVNGAERERLASAFRDGLERMADCS